MRDKNLLTSGKSSLIVSHML